MDEETLAKNIEGVSMRMLDVRKRAGPRTSEEEELVAKKGALSYFGKKWCAGLSNKAFTSFHPV